MAGEASPLLENNRESAVPTYTATSILAPTWNTIALATYYTVVVCLAGLQFGLMVAFSSPFLDDFQTHLPANFTAWSGFNHCVYQDLIGPIGPAGAVVGSVLSSPVVAVTGFVTGMVVMSFLFLFGWLLIGVSYFTYHGGAWSAVFFRTLLLLGRLLTGVSAGWAAGVVPVGVYSHSNLNSNSLFECTIPVGTRTPHGPM